MENNFHSNLNRYFNNNEMATGIVLQELAKALVHDRENFIEVLKNANVGVLEGSSDAQLIDSFVKNAPGNKQLLLGAALLVNHRNKTTNFDGEEELSDKGVKQAFYSLDGFFNATDEETSNAGGAWAGAIKSIADVGGQVSGKVMDAQAQKKRGASTMLAQQQQARRDLTQSVSAQRQKQQEEALKEKAKTKRTLLIVGGVGVALLLGVGIYFATRKKN